jgi:hypothetical protein
MPKPNNPYRRPPDATKESAQQVNAYYGTPATDKAINHAAGGRNVAPASRFQAVGFSNAPTTPTPDATSPSEVKPKTRKTKIGPTQPVSEPTAVTEEDLFEW